MSRVVGSLVNGFLVSLTRKSYFLRGFDTGLIAFFVQVPLPIHKMFLLISVMKKISNKPVHHGALTITFFGELFQVHPFNLLQQTTRNSFNAKYTKLVLTE